MRTTGGAYERRTIRVGPGIPADLHLPMAAPITVDYRNDEATLARQAGVKVSVGAHTSGGVGSVAADTCRNDAQCNDCNPCTIDTCAVGTCTGGPHGGFACTPETANADCLGTCNGGVRNGAGCGSDLDCCGDGGAILNGTCVFFPCVSGVDHNCVNALIPKVCKGGSRDRLDCLVPGDCPGGSCDNQFVGGSECDDGLECNGSETCAAGACVASATPLCTTPLVCDETRNTCLDACTTDGDCPNDDGTNCTIERCDVATGICGIDPILPCGPGATCNPSAKHCSLSNAACTGTGAGTCTAGEGSCVDGEVLVCGAGRCCDGLACSNVLFSACASPKTWLATPTACGEIGDTGVADRCPQYGAGMAPLGPYTVEVGPITDGSCGALARLGDDYDVPSNSSGFIKVTLLRFVHSAQVSARIAVEFWDVSGTPTLVEDIFIPNGVNTGVHGPLVRQVVLDPPLKVRDNGVLAVSIATNFAASGTIAMIATDAVDVGANDTTLSFVDGALVNDLMGQCSGGSRDGLFCDRRNANVDCIGGGTCNDIPDVLAYELVADLDVAAPLGGCCDVGAGTCTQQLGWVCEAAGNVFRGEGVNCAVCLGGTNDGTQCDTSAVCTGGGVCTEAVCSNHTSTPCLVDSDCPDFATGETCQLIAQCTVQACCNTTTGECTTVVGLGSTCPGGTTTRGFATSCEPDACPQPLDKSRDNCTLVTPTVVAVPAPGDPPNFYTLSGSNATATFDDWNQGLCVAADGSNHATCDPNVTPDPNVQCAVGEVCTRLCGSGIFDPGGATRDPGWWVGFSIDRCADVRIDTCETVPLVRPAWAFISQGCPCANFIGNAGIRGPLGLGVGTDGGARGAPFCPNDDNFWQTFRNLPAGTYYYPVLSDPDSDIAAPVVGGPGGSFQFHVATQACEIAACCLPESYCVVDPALNLAGINLDGSGAPIPCTGPGTQGSCAAGQFCRYCALDNQTNCELASGAWLSKPITPNKICLGGTNNGVEDCADDAACPGGVCLTVGSITSCGLAPDESDSPCNVGSCCTGPGACADLKPQSSIRMDRTTCDNTANSTYFGGATCNFPTPPCPICTAAAVPGNCQDPNAGFITAMDRQNGGAIGGYQLADDFVAVTPAIGQFCFSPAYIQFNDQGTLIGECANPTGSGVHPPPEQFEVRFYDDANGFPGAELANSPGPVTTAASRWNGGNFRTWEASVVFNPAITGFVVGQRYWIAFSGKGSPFPPLGTGCSVYLTGSLDGNLYSLQDIDGFQPVSWTNQDNTQVTWDMSFCIEGGLTPPPAVIGACCRCDGTCTDNVPWELCTTSFQINEGQTAIPLLHQGDGFFYANQECSQISCVNVGTLGGGCPGSGPGLVGENCANPEVVTLGVNEVSVLTVDTLCSTTDGRSTFVNGCDTGTGVNFVNDKWFEVTSNCDGKMQIDFCGDNDYDTAIAVYKGPDGTGACPVGSGGCEPDETPSVLMTGKCIDTPCKPSAGQPSFETFTVPNTCFKIRVGGDDASGTVQLELKCAAVTCRNSAQPVQDSILNGAGSTVQSVKNRFLSFQAPTPTGLEGPKAVRVKIVSLPGVCANGTNNGTPCSSNAACTGGGTCTGGFAALNGTSWWVDNPIDSNELPGKSFTDPIVGPSFKSAKLRTTPLYQDWSQFGMIHIWDERIIPSRKRPGQPIEPAIYWIQIIDESCDVNVDEFPDTYSTPLIVQNAQWGDLATSQFRAPDGVVTVTEDVLGVLAKFGNAPGAPIKARAEMVGSGPSGPVPGLTGKVEIGDVLAVLGAFTGGSYPFSPPAALDAAPPATRAVTSR